MNSTCLILVPLVTTGCANAVVPRLQSVNAILEYSIKNRTSTRYADSHNSGSPNPRIFHLPPRNFIFLVNYSMRNVNKCDYY